MQRVQYEEIPTGMLPIRGFQALELLDRVSFDPPKNNGLPSNNYLNKICNKYEKWAIVYILLNPLKYIGLVILAVFRYGLKGEAVSFQSDLCPKTTASAAV